MANLLHEVLTNYFQVGKHNPSEPENARAPRLSVRQSTTASKDHAVPLLLYVVQLIRGRLWLLQ